MPKKPKRNTSTLGISPGEIRSIKRALEESLVQCKEDYEDNRLQYLACNRGSNNVARALNRLNFTVLEGRDSSTKAKRRR